MDDFSFFELMISVIAAVVLFVYALKGFSEDVQEAGGDALRGALARLTARPVPGFGLGAGLTALIQSSSAVAGITVALVGAGTITFRGSLPVFLGANVGTTSTSWLVALDFSLLGPLLIVASVVISILPGRISLYGRSILYLGVILFALDLVSGYVSPLKDNEDVASWMVVATNPLVAFLIGVFATAALQSSSVVIGLAIIAVQQQLIGGPDVVPIILGANIGTTSTALIASFSLGRVAQRSALANLVFNVLGVLLFIPVLPWVTGWLVALLGTGDLLVATVHLIFNIGVAVIGFVLLNPVANWLDPDKPIALPGFGVR